MGKSQETKAPENEEGGQTQEKERAGLMDSGFRTIYQDIFIRIFTQGNFSWPEGLPENFSQYFLHQTRTDGIQLLIHERVSETAGWSSWPSAVRSEFSAAAQNDAIVDILRQQDFAELHGALAQENIRPILLKGAALSLTHYPSSYLRPRSDTDFLIPAGSLARLTPLMERKGYRSEISTGREYGSYQISFSRKNAAGINVIYDVHWKLCNPELFASALSYEEITAKAGETVIFGEKVKVIGALHALLHACIHLVAHHCEERKLIWLYDIHLLANGQNGEWFETFYALAAEKKMRRICGYGLRLAQEAFETRISPDTVKRLDSREWREESARFLEINPSIFSIFFSNLRMLGWRDKGTLLYQNIFPTPHFMMEKYRFENKFFLPWFYLWRLLAGFPKLFRPIRAKA